MGAAGHVPGCHTPRSGRRRNEGRAAARQYAPAYLQLRPEELEQGLRQHWNCPPDLAAWLTRQAGVGSTAAAGAMLR